MPDTRFDFVMTNHQNQPIAVVDVKGRQGLTEEIATAYHRNLLAHLALPATSYFLLLSQDAGYLWKREQASELDAPPSLIFPMGDVIARYDTNTTHERLIGSVLELLVLQWLAELSDTPNVTMEPEKSLERIGFLDAIHGGSLKEEVAL